MESIDRYADDERRYGLVFDTRYGIFYNQAHAKLYGRALMAASLVQIIAGSAAVVSVITKDPALATATGILIAIVGAIGALVDLGGRAARFNARAAQYSELDAEAGTLSNDELSRRLSALQRDTIDGEIDALCEPARNAALQANGLDREMVALSRWNRFVAAFA